MSRSIRIDGRTSGRIELKAEHKTHSQESAQRLVGLWLPTFLPTVELLEKF